MEALGYVLSRHVLDAADYGIPQCFSTQAFRHILKLYCGRTPRNFTSGDAPVQVLTMDETTLIVNTRSSLGADAGGNSHARVGFG